MKKETYKNKSDGFVGDKNASQDINDDGVVSMQGMIIYPAAIGIEKWFCKNVIHIYQHSGEKNEIIPLPVFLIVPVSDKANGKKVEEIVGDGLEHFISVISYQLSVISDQLSVKRLTVEKFES